MATQTGSIDLTATNGVKLFAEAGFDSAEQTYATKGELSVTNDAVALRATKTEAYQSAQPNLSPFFSSHNTDGTYPDGNADGYWQPSANKLYNRSCFTALDDGWAHLEACDSVQKEFVPPRIDSLSAGDKVTMLVEYRNATNTGSGANFYTRNYSSNVQLTNNWSFITTQTGDGEERHVFTVSSADGQQEWNGLANVTFTSRASSTWTGDIRISFYLGEYSGPYKPYSGDVLYATQAELKVTADGISSEVSKKVGNNEIISKINQSAETVKIQADKVEIDGTAIFTAISSDVDNAIADATRPFFQGRENSTGYIHLGHVPYAVGSTSNYSHFHLTGRIGGWQSNNSGSIDVTFKSRGNNATYNTVDRKDDAIDTTKVDVLVYTGTDTYTHYWLKVDGYWYAQLYAEYAQFVEDDHTRTTTEPTGTCVWKLSEHTSVAQTNLDNLKIGGKNLLLWTGEGETYSDHQGTSRLWNYTTIYGTLAINGNTAVFTKNSDGLTNNASGLRVMSLTESGGSASSSANYGQSTQYGIDFKIGERYTFSCDVKTDGNRVGLSMQYYNGTSVWKDVGIGEFVPADTDWHRYSFTFTIPSGFVCITALGVYCQLLEGVKLELKNIKLECGNKATDWTPAPEDVDASIETASGNGFYVKWDDNQGTTYAGGEARFYAYDPVTKTKGTGAGWVLWNGVKRTVPSATFNPNSVYPYNIPIYLVLRLSSATSTTGTIYAVWYKDGWKWGYPDATTDDTIYNWTWVETTDIVLASCVEPGSEAQFTDCQTYDPPLLCTQVTTITTTASSAQALANTANTTANNATPKANAVKRTQRIYYRSNSSTAPSTPGTASSNWVTKGDDGNAAWTKMHVAISSTHKYIYTCEQYEMANGTVGYTSVLLDNTITVIDGGNIITGSVKANSIDAESGTFDTANIPNLSAAKITSGDISADRIKANVISAINSLTAGTIDAARINATQLTIGQSQVTDLTSDLAAKADSDDIPTKVSELDNDTGFITDDDIQIGGRNLLANSKALTDKWSKERTTVTDGVATITKAASGDCRLYQIPADGYWAWAAGDTYTVSIDAKGDSTDCVLRFQATSIGGTTYSQAVTLTTEWARYSATFTVVKDSTGSLSFFNEGTINTAIQVRNPKLERGTKPTDWTPAPEDTDSAISTKLDASYNRIWYAECSTVAATTAKVATITPATTEFTLVKGQTVNVWFSATNTGAVGDITLSVNNTVAKGIRYLNNGALANLPNANYLKENQIVTFTYDGTYWVTDFSYYDSSGITNARYRTQYANAIKAAAAITSGRVICGTSAGYKNIAASVEFDLDYPLLYASAAIAAGSTGSENYLTMNAVNAKSNATVQGAATNKMVYLKGTVTGNTFKIAASNFLTCTVPNSADGFVYIPLGIAYNTTPNIYFSSNKDLYAYVDGAFGPVSIREASAAAKTATNYISLHPTDGIKIANANPATATTYQHLTATSTEFVVDSDSMLELDGTNGARVGKEDGINTCVGSGGFYIRDSNDVRAGFEYEAASGSHPGNTTIESSDGLKLYGNVSSIDGTETGRAYILLSGTRHNRDSEEASVAIVANSDPDNSSGDGNGSHIAAIHLAGGNTSGDSIPSGEPRVSIHVGGESFDIGKPTSLYSTGSVSVANQSWVSVANLTIPSTGTWMVVVTGDFAANATGRRVMACTRNAAPSSTPAYDSQNSLIMAPVNGAATKFNSSAIIDFDAGDVYYAGVWQNSGSALTTQIMIKAVRLI